jgi:hypothetical protein
VIVLGAATLVARSAPLARPDDVRQRLEAIRVKHPTFARDHRGLAS